MEGQTEHGLAAAAKTAVRALEVERRFVDGTADLERLSSSHTQCHVSEPVSAVPQLVLCTNLIHWLQTSLHDVVYVEKSM